MRKVSVFVTLLTLLMMPAAIKAAHYADFYVIPVAGHINGINGTMWVSDIAVQNFSATPMTAQLIFIRSGEGVTDNVFDLPTSGGLPEVVIPAGGSVILNDVLNNFQGAAQTIGSILIGADRPFAVTSRAYSVTPSGDTVGQTVVPVRDFIDNTIGDTNLAMAVAYIPGLISNGRYRTNLGFVAGTSNLSGQMKVQFTLKAANGQTIGTKEFLVLPGSFNHVQFSSKAIGSATFDAGAAEVRITEGDGAVAPYASVIDNVTADAVYINGVFPPNAVIPKTAGDSAFRSLFRRITGH